MPFIRGLGKYFGTNVHITDGTSSPRTVSHNYVQWLRQYLPHSHFQLEFNPHSDWLGFIPSSCVCLASGMSKYDEEMKGDREREGDVRAPLPAEEVFGNSAQDPESISSSST